MHRLSYAPIKFLLLAILSLSFFSLSCGNGTAESANAAAVVGESAPDFVLKDLSGNNVSLANFYGKKNNNQSYGCRAKTT